MDGLREIKISLARMAFPGEKVADYIVKKDLGQDNLAPKKTQDNAHDRCVGGRKIPGNQILSLVVY